MITTEVTAPSTTPISIAEAKSHMRIDHGDDDSDILELIKDATEYVEKEMCRKLITQTWKMWINSWPAEIDVRFGDLQSVTHVKYTDSDEDQSTFSSDDYLVDVDSIPGRIVLKDGESWPGDTLSPKNPIEIQFVTGYGDAATDVPNGIRRALKVLVAHWYEQREMIVTGTIVANVPTSFAALIRKYTVWKWAM